MEWDSLMTPIPEDVALLIGMLALEKFSLQRRIAVLEEQLRKLSEDQLREKK